MSDVVVVNENDEVIGTKSYAEAHQDGSPHRIAVVYVENLQGRILVQVRASGGLDHSAAGHVDAGETYLEAAHRELQEELGIRGVELKRIGHGISEELQPARGVHSVHVFDVFTCTAEPGELQEEEVEAVYWADPADVIADMRSVTAAAGKYAKGFRDSIKIYDLNRNYSCQHDRE